MNGVAAEYAVRMLRTQMDHHVTRRVAGRGFELQQTLDLVIGGHEIRLAALDHR